ncbi:hypothetical protein AB0H63_05305 [Micromonospora echinospora]|uniref:hypothetical protein n=1 Tax=Micromonospora echinospora TaxID=1877 RepID=UPI0033D92E8D
MPTSEFGPALLRRLIRAGAWTDRRTDMVAAMHLLTFTEPPDHPVFAELVEVVQIPEYDDGHDIQVAVLHERAALLALPAVGQLSDDDRRLLARGRKLPPPVMTESTTSLRPGDSPRDLPNPDSTARRHRACPTTASITPSVTSWPLVSDFRMQAVDCAAPIISLCRIALRRVTNIRDELFDHVAGLRWAARLTFPFSHLDTRRRSGHSHWHPVRAFRSERRTFMATYKFIGGVEDVVSYRGGVEDIVAG